MGKNLSVVAVLLSATTAVAGFAWIGSPIQGAGGWFQRFQEDGVGDFDLVAVQIASPVGSFESPTHRNFTAGGWSTTYELGTPPTLATAVGATVDWMQWDIGFTGQKSDSLAFDLVAFWGDDRVDSVHASWNGSAWGMTTGEWSPDRSALVPVLVPTPDGALLGAIGLGLVGWAKRKVS